jgi:hypothetical protein
MLDNTYINCNVKTNFGKKVVQTQKKMVWTNNKNTMNQEMSRKIYLVSKSLL